MPPVLNAGWRRGGWHASPSSPTTPTPRAQRRVASWGVARPPRASPNSKTSRAQRRVASWGVAPRQVGRLVLGRGCSTPGGVVGGGTAADAAEGSGFEVLNAGWRRGGWHLPALASTPRASCAQRRVASWGVAPGRPGLFAPLDDVLNAGWRRGGWHWLVHSLRTAFFGCSTPGGVVGGGTGWFTHSAPPSLGAQRRVASWGVAPRLHSQQRQIREVLNAGWRRGGWHAGTHEERYGPLDVLNAGWRRGGWHPARRTLPARS